MSSFANVNVGTIANDGTGTALRAAFQTINQNFAEIATGNADIVVNAPVQSVAGRTGNVQLNVTDVQDAVSSYYVLTQIAAGNAYVNSVAATFGNANVSLVSSRVDVLDANLGTATTSITALTANAGVQGAAINTLTTQVNSINANLGSVTINLTDVNESITNINNNIVGLEDNFSFLLSNAQSQSQSIDSVQAGLDFANILIGDFNTEWQVNAATQATAINTLTTNAAYQTTQITATNAAIVTANVGMKSYVDGYVSELANRITGANAAIVTANVGMKSYVDYLNAAMASNVATVANDHNNLAGALNNINELLANTISQESEINSLTSSLASTNSNVSSLTASTTATTNGLRANITAANAAIVTANVNMKAYVDYNVQQVDDQVHTVSTALVGVINGQAGANIAIITANTGMKSYVDALNASMVSNISTVANDHNNLNGALNNIVALYANAAAQSSQIASLNANVGSANAVLAVQSATINALSGVVTNLNNTLSLGPIAVYNSITGDELASNGAVYSTTGFFWSNGQPYGGNADTGNLSITDYTITTVSDTTGSFGITLSPANGGEIHLSNNTGINNTNPAYWLDIGNINEDYNTGSMALSFSNGIGTPGDIGSGYFGNSAVWTFDWWDQNGRGTNNDGTKHSNLGLYRDGLFGKPYIILDTTAPDAGTPIKVVANAGIVVGPGGVSTDGTVTTANAVVTDTLVVNNISANTIATTGTGVPTIASSTNVNLTANNAVVVTQSLFRLANFTQEAVANLTPQAGDMVYNTTYANIQIYTGSSWGNLTVS